MPERIIITAKDIVNITGYSPRTAQRLMETMRMAFGKERFQFITIEEFCAFSGLTEQEIRPFLIK